MGETRTKATRVSWKGEDAIAPGEYARHPVDALAPAPPDVDETYERKPHHFAGVWFARTPNGLLLHFKGSDVVENDDGSITVPHPIDVGTERDGAHVGWTGQLTRGEWIERAPDLDTTGV